MTHTQPKYYFLLSCLFHILGCAIIFTCYNQFLQKPYEPKHETLVDVSFVSAPRINKQSLQKTPPQPKTHQKIIPKPVVKPIQKIVQKPVPVVKKTLSPKPPQAIPPVVKIADIHQKPLSQIKQTVDSNTQNHKISNITHTHKTVSASAEKAHNVTAKAPIFFDKNNYIAYVKQKIAEHKSYPIAAKRRAIEGRVGLKISIKPTGDIASLHITDSSGSDILDNAAIKSVRDASPFKKTSEYVNFSFGINYYLE